MPPDKIESLIKEILSAYKGAFDDKVYAEENNEHDVLMDVFGITPELKRENRQYWGRELGKCWELVVSAVFQATRDDYGPGLVIGKDEPCDCIVGKDAIDTKYRVGSGDSGTLKKFKQYGELLRSKGLNPIFLMVRTDNLGAAITACKAGGWTVLTGDDSFQYVFDKSGFDLKICLEGIAQSKEFYHNR